MRGRVSHAGISKEFIENSGNFGGGGESLARRASLGNLLENAGNFGWGGESLARRASLGNLLENAGNFGGDGDVRVERDMETCLVYRTCYNQAKLNSMFIIFIIKCLD